MHITEPDAAGRMKISGKLDIYNASTLRDALVSSVQTLSKISLDLTEVEACDAIGLQLLWSARRYAGIAGKCFSVTGASPAVLNACTALGLASTEIAIGSQDL